MGILLASQWPLTTTRARERQSQVAVHLAKDSGLIMVKGAGSRAAQEPGLLALCPFPRLLCSEKKRAGPGRGDQADWTPQVGAELGLAFQPTECVLLSGKQLLRRGGCGTAQVDPLLPSCVTRAATFRAFSPPTLHPATLHLSHSPEPSNKQQIW